MFVTGPKVVEVIYHYVYILVAAIGLLGSDK